MTEELVVKVSESLQRTGPLQSGISQMEWLSYRSGGRGMFPNIHRVVAVPEGSSDDVVRGVVDTLLRRHEVLRTTFDADGDGRPRQSVHENVHAVLPRIADEASLRRFVEAPFDIGSGPPIRCARTSDGNLVFAVAHIAADEMGVAILTAELTELLAAHGQQRNARLRAKVPQPIDRALYEHEGRGRSRVENALRHWNTTLQDFPVTVFPLSRGKPRAEMVCAEVESSAAIPALASLHRAHGASPASVFIAAAYTALAIQFNRDRMGLNLTWSSREFPSTREMVASVFRDMPLLVDLAGRPSFSEVLRQVQKAILVSGRHMGFDVMEFHERAGRIGAERGRFLPNPEAINCTFDDVDFESAEPGGDLRTLLADSRLTTYRSNDPTDVCNLYIAAYPVAEGRLLVYAGLDEAVSGVRHSADLVRLMEAILVHAAVEGDLTFAAAKSLAGTPWRPEGARWARVDDVWVDVDFLTARLREHPAVHDADVREEQGRLTAYVNADLQPWELRDFLLSTDNGRSAVLSPHHFVMRRADGVTVAGPGVDRPMLAPRGAAEQALKDAVAKANELAGPTMAGAYLTVGGRLHLAPRVLSLLRDAGFEGITVADLRRPTSLVALAGRLRRCQ